MIDTIIFDMDGVLIDSEPAYFDVENELFNKLGLQIPRELHESFVGMTMPTIWGIIKAKNDLPHSIEELVKMHQKGIYDYFIQINKLQPISGIPVLIKHLDDKGFKLAVASSTNIKLVKIILTKLEIEHFFQAVCGGDEVVNGKPAPDVFLLAATKLASAPEECLVWEDSCNGVQAAIAANMKIIGYQNIGSGNQDLSLADWVIDSFENLDYLELDRRFFDHG